MDEQLAVPLVSLAISLATFIYTLVMARRKAGVSQMATLRADVEQLTRRVIECEEDRQQLREEVLDLKRTMVPQNRG